MYKKIFFSFCVVFFLLNIWACQNSSLPYTITKHDFQTEKIALKNYPKWEKHDEIENVEVIFLSPLDDEKDGFQENLIVVVNSLQENEAMITPKTYAKKQIEVLELAYNGFKIEKEEVIEFNTLSGYLMVYAYKRNNKPIKIASYILFNENEAIHLDYYAAAEDFDRHFSDAEKIIHSLKVL